MPTRHVPPFLCFLGLGLLAGCESSTVTITSVYHPTLIRVSPDGFLGNVPCRPGALGAMQTYVATIFDVGEDFAPAEPFALPSSGPVSCMNDVSFSRVIEPHRYHAEIQGYDRDDLLPLGSDDPNVTLGIPILIDPVTRQAVAPRWTTTCGGDTPVTARTAVERTIGDCKPLVDSGNLGPAVVEVSIDAALGELSCGAEPGMVARFDVRLGNAPARSAACGETVRLENVPPNGTLIISVEAFEGSGTLARWGSTCQARPAAGVTVKASCPPLSDRGALDVDPVLALGALGLDCSALGELAVTLVDDAGAALTAPSYVDAGGCDLSTRFAGIRGGPATASATLRASGTELGTARCTGSVIPGRAVTADCVAEP